MRSNEPQNDFLTENVEFNKKEVGDSLPLDIIQVKSRRKPRWGIISFSVILAAVVITVLIWSYDTDWPKDIESKSDICIILDAGHGGHDSGCAYGEALEKELNLLFALGIGESLTGKGYQIIYTREKDEFITLESRADIANKKKADFFISLHCNAAETHNASGIEIYFNREKGAGELASDILSSMTMNLNAKSRGSSRGYYTVLTRSNMPAILIETGFLSNEDERSKLMNEQYRAMLINAVSTAVDEYMSAIVNQ